MKFYPLDDYYKSFSYGVGVLSFKSNLVFLTLHGETIDKWNNKDIFKCFKALDIFGWLRWEDNITVHLYFKKEILDHARKWIEENWIGADPK